nr:GIY-YIG nuclease family protein [uncultured Rhodopila sp.]
MLPAPIGVVLPHGRDVLLPAGRYLYAGSARGPGGMRARLARHQRADKTPHWHIDLLTMAGTMAGAWIFPGGDECAIVAGLGHLPVPLPGFGSSDCRRCVSHLLAWPDGIGIDLPDGGLASKWLP